MAYVVSSLTGSSGASATIVTALPAHITGDLLVVFLVNDVGGTDIVQSGGSDWTMVDSTRTNGGSSRFAYKIAASSSEASPTFSGRNDDWFYTSITIRDADPTTPILTIAQSNFTAAATIDSPALTTSEADVLVLYGIAGDTALTYNFPAGDLVYIAQGVISTAISSHIGWRNVIPTTTAFPTVTVTPSASATGVRWLIPIKNKSGGGMHGEARTVATKVRDYGTVFDAGTYSSPNTALGAITIESIAVSTATAIADGTTQYAQINSAEVAAVWAGGFDTFGAIKDLSGKILSVNWVLASGSVATTHTSTNGAIFVIMDDSNNWKAFRLALNLYGQLELVNNRINYIDVDSGTTVATSGACNTSRIIKFGFMYAKPSSSNQNYFRLFSVYAQDKVILTGGNSATPLTPAMADKVVDTWKISGMTSLQGSGQTISGQGIQIGDGGTNVTYANFAGQSLEMPLPFASNYLWNVADNKFTVTIYAGSSDTINLSSCILRANSPQNFAIHASSTAADVYNFNGLSLIGWTVTDNKGLTWNGTTFSSGGTVTVAGGGDMTNCSIARTTSVNAALAITANGSTLDGTTLDVTGTSAAYHLELGTAVTAITLTDVTFTGTPGTDKVHVLATTGTVTITISGTTTLAAGDVASAGATVVISAPLLYQTVTVSGATTGSRIQIYDTTSSTELYNGTPAFPYTWTDSVAAAADRAIRLRVSYVSGVTAKDFIEANIGTCGQTSGTAAVSYLVNQVADTTYNSNAIDGPAIYATSGITFTDAATDRVNCNIGGGSVTYKTIYACFVYWNFTATGIANDFTYISAPDTANYLLSGMKIRNTSATDLSVTGGYGRDATSGASVDIIDTAGSTGNIFLAPDHVVAYATGSGVTAQDITDIAAATAAAVPSASANASAVAAQAAATPFAVDVKKVNGVTITGTGALGDEWGP